ncbi:hypothetical protein BDQ12DRAFT_694137 [Crucibulum laeve]|uniref:PQ loop repeat-domain-containing protein n=1 Tax=Crucibulum laeve TaxID=68775 RepID=A0A5C3LFQ4_9AGAR|nr:hypothetical protein BDQ12DRAFT_694137 [Crucibulum laeve]
MSTCEPHHDWFTATLTFGLCVGLIISYLPQHLRIINARSSEGFSPIFLLLGSTSSAAGFLNMVTMQWSIVRCCRFFSFSSCLEAIAGVIQVGLQWFLFSVVFVLYMIYYPTHLKYLPSSLAEATTSIPIHHQLGKKPERPRKAPEWKLSIALAWVTAAHLLFITFVTFSLLLTNTPPAGDSQPTPPVSGSPVLPHQISLWATTLGLSSALLAAIQYAPQLLHTYRTKLVGALSIPMMCIQSPGAVAMVVSIMLRRGTNWTSWITFAVSGIMQGSLLIMCIVWKFRQRRLKIDDFGRPLPPAVLISPASPAVHHAHREADSWQADGNEDEEAEAGDSMPGLVTSGESPAAVRKALTRALESAVGADLRREGPAYEEEVPPNEETPLLRTGPAAQTDEDRKGSWVRWFGW